MANAAGRRMTLASLDANQNNGQAQSAIPVPSSAVKSVKTFGAGAAQPRQSMIPQQSLQPRQSIAHHASLGTSQQQQQTQQSQQAQHSQQQLLQSQQHPQLNTPHHLNQSGRRGDGGMYAGRQSTASAGRQSVAAPTPK